ncbi:MAG: hypothetical protein BAJALOKI3v1_50140 [Promethearchaeota archaeon]|nr:MAG: hypothetical protein BAJALOKI3v1_50140 [Candidatus Lokiarchaeota archaeon]
MPDITNTQAIKFCNEQIRPLSEKFRALKAEVDATLVDWNGGIGTTIGSSADDSIADGREAEGISRLTAADVANLVTQLQAYQTQLDQAGVADVINKPCVRPLSAS